MLHHPASPARHNACTSCVSSLLGLPCFCPSLLLPLSSVHCRHIPSEARRNDNVADMPIIVTTYECASRDYELLASMKWRCLVIDEGHRCGRRRPTSTSCDSSLRRTFVAQEDVRGSRNCPSCAHSRPVPHRRPPASRPTPAVLHMQVEERGRRHPQAAARVHEASYFGAAGG